MVVELQVDRYLAERASFARSKVVNGSLEQEVVRTSGSAVPGIEENKAR
jgi:hypothetical protein